MHDDKSVLSGARAIRDFLDPAKLAPVPLVELPAPMNPLTRDGVRTWTTSIVRKARYPIASAWR